MTTTGTSMTTISVGGAAPYDVLIGPGASSHVATALPDATSVAVVHDERLGRLAEPVASPVEAAGLPLEALSVPSGDTWKTLDVVARLWDRFPATKLSRTEAVVSVGGGATT